MPFFINLMIYKILRLHFAFLLLGCSTDQSNKYSDHRFHFIPESAVAGNPLALIRINNSYQLYYPTDELTKIGWKIATSKDLMRWEYQQGFIPGCSEVPINNPKRILSAALIIDSKEEALNKNSLLLFKTSWPCELDPKSLFTEPIRSGDLGNTWVKTGQKVSINLELGRVKNPKIIYADHWKKWILLATTDQKIHFFESIDLLKWNYISSFGPAGNTNLQWENPDLAQLSGQENELNKKWLLSVSTGHPAGKGFSAVQYFIGTFDGKSFQTDSFSEIPSFLDYGKDFVAGMIIQTNEIIKNNPVLLVGKIGNQLYNDELPDKRLNGMLSVPRRLKVKTEMNKIHLNQEPQIDFSSIEGSIPVQSINDLTGSIHADIEVAMDIFGKQKQGLQLLKTADQKVEIGFDPVHQEVYIDRTESGFIGFHPNFAGIDRYRLNQNTQKIKLRILLDKNLIEVFIQNGEAVISSLIFPKDLYGRAEWFGSPQNKIIKGWVLR